MTMIITFRVIEAETPPIKGEIYTRSHSLVLENGMTRYASAETSSTVVVHDFDRRLNHEYLPRFDAGMWLACPMGRLL